MRVATVARRQGSKAALAPVSVKRYLLANGLADLIGFEDALGENAHPTWSVSALVDAACAQVAFTTVLNLWGPHGTAALSSGEGENVSKSACGNEKVGTLIGPELCSTRSKLFDTFQIVFQKVLGLLTWGTPPNLQSRTFVGIWNSSQMKYSRIKAKEHKQKFHPRLSLLHLYKVQRACSSPGTETFIFQKRLFWINFF